jgi:serine/threonine protein kinase
MNQGKTKTCSSCGNDVPLLAVRCKHCGNKLVAQSFSGNPGANGQGGPVSESGIDVSKPQARQSDLPHARVSVPSPGWDDSLPSILVTGTLIGRKYRIEKLIGSGGMGKVYEALQIPIGRRVAIKLLHRSLAGDKQMVERFHKEAERAGSIGHDNICEITDFGITEDGAPYLVMTRLHGASLADLAERERLSTRRIVDIVCQTLSALEAAHDVNIIHRDLKPDNIFVTKMGDREDFVKLLDFGIAKVMGGGDASQFTMTGTILGTPHYMAPEIARGSRDVDQRADIYAIGVILFEVLTGRRPFEGDSYNEVMAKILMDPFPKPRDLDPSIPSALEDVILRAMARNRCERYANAREMREALQLVLEDGTPAPERSSAKQEAAENPLRTPSAITTPVRFGKNPSPAPASVQTRLATPVRGKRAKTMLMYADPPAKKGARPGTQVLVAATTASSFEPAQETPFGADGCAEGASATETESARNESVQGSDEEEELGTQHTGLRGLVAFAAAQRGRMTLRRLLIGGGTLAAVLALAAVFASLRCGGATRDPFENAVRATAPANTVRGAKASSEAPKPAANVHKPGGQLVDPGGASSLDPGEAAEDQGGAAAQESAPSSKNPAAVSTSAPRGGETGKTKRPGKSKGTYVTGKKGSRIKMEYED